MVDASNNGFLGGGPPIAQGGPPLGFSIPLATQATPIPGQTFRTIPLPNFQPALYGLAIRSPGGFGLVNGFTFPLSPESLRKEYTAMSNIYDVAGSPLEGGVHREVDVYGLSPATFTIEGTTGWQRHSTDGYSSTGLQAVNLLEQFIYQYAQINAAAALAGVPPATLEFYDYFREDFWQVEPVGPQGTRMNRTKPILVNYFFKLAGIRQLGGPSGALNDLIAIAFSITSGVAINAIDSLASTISSTYAPVTTVAV